MPDPSFKELVQTHYFQEFERRRELNFNLTIVSGVIALVSGGGLAMMADLRLPLNGLELWLATGLTGVFVSVLFAVYQAIRAFVGHSYRYISGMAHIRDWRREASASNFTGDEVDQETVRLICEQYLAAVETNDRANDVKSGRVHRASQAAVAAVAFSIIAAVPWAAIQLTKPPSAQTLDETNNGRKRAH